MHIGVIGGGQLGRMLALAGIPLGDTFTFVDPSPEACASDAGGLLVAPYDDIDALEGLSAASDVITFEFENVPAETAREVAKGVALWPPPEALEKSQDRLAEKQFFESAGLGIPPYRTVDTDEDLSAAAEELGFPLVVKTRREGYDGKGQVVVSSDEEIAGVVERLGAGLIAEAFVEFDREVSVVAARSADGDIAIYPLSENHHHGGILRASFSLPDENGPISETARTHVTKVLEGLGYVGVLAIEFFEKAGELLGNEMAPRVHNSGHWTIEGAETSQFENHVRAVTKRPLGSTRAVGYAAMLNLIGEIPDTNEVIAVPGAHLHLYGKAPRAGRKVGHITLRGDSPSDLSEGLQRLGKVPGVHLPQRLAQR